MAAKHRGIGLAHLTVVAQALFALGACAPAGTHYGSWTDGPAAAFTTFPNDDCKRTDVTQGVIATLNGKIGKIDGPPAQVVAASEFIRLEPHMPGYEAGFLNCRGTLQTTAGAIGPGVLQINSDRALNNNGTIASFNVSDAKWESDEDRQRKESHARKERARAVAEAPAREAKMIADMRASARSEPNKTVHCGINRSHFWTTNAVCFALIEEAKHVSSKFGTASRDEILHECARNIARKLPGKNRSTYLNACEELIASYGA